MLPLRTLDSAFSRNYRRGLLKLLLLVWFALHVERFVISDQNLFTRLARQSLRCLVHGDCCRNEWIWRPYAPPCSRCTCSHQTTTQIVNHYAVAMALACRYLDDRLHVDRRATVADGGPCCQILLYLASVSNMLQSPYAMRICHDELFWLELLKWCMCND